MAKAIHSARHQRLISMLIEKRRAAGMTQAEVAKALGRHQPFIANIEKGERRVDVLELIDLAAIMGFDPSEMVADLKNAAL